MRKQTPPDQDRRTGNRCPRGWRKGRSQLHTSSPRRVGTNVRDVVFVLVTLAVFAVLGLVVRAVEKL
jgi:hypothetical protein